MARVMRVSPRLILYATILTVWAAWEVLAHLRIYLGDIFPSSFSVLTTLGSFLITKDFYRHAWVTLLEILLAFPIGTAIGIATGISMGGFRLLGEVVEPYISGLMATPRIVWFPVALMMFGSGIESKIMLGALGAFFPTAINTYVGMLNIPVVYTKVGKVFRVSPYQRVTKIYIPALTRPLLVGARISLGVCITPILLAEIKGPSDGLGNLIIEYYNHFEITQMYAVLTFVTGVVVIINVLLGQLINHSSKPAHN